MKLGDKSTIARILDEGKNHNQVMDTITHLSTKIGPRLTGSTNVDTANKWALEQFKSWGLSAELWQWGEVPVRFDRGPSTAKVGTMRDNGEFRSQHDMEFTTLAWTAGTDGPVRGQVLKVPETDEQFDKIQDKIHGAWMLIKATPQGGRRGVGGFAGGMTARQKFFADMRKKAGASETSAAESRPELKSEAAPATSPPTEGIAGYWEGTAAGGPVAEPGTPFSIEVKNTDGKLSGTMTYADYGFSGPMKNPKWDESANSFTYSWDSPVGTATYTFKLDGQKVTGESKLPQEIGGGILALSGKRGTPQRAKPSEESTSIEERVFALGPAGYVSSSSDERVRTGGLADWRKLSADTLPKDCEIMVRSSDYDYMNSRLADGNKVEVEINAANKFTPGPFPLYDTIADIKGTQWPEEVVIISAHLDSWNGPGSMGTTDNAPAHRSLSRPPESSPPPTPSPSARSASSSGPARNKASLAVLPT
jgi:hypothetical protein